MLAKRTISPSDSAKQRRLLEIIKAQSLFEGAEYILSSGRKSKYYFNLKATTLDPEGGGLVADLVYSIVSRDEAEYIGGLASGAIPIIAAVCARSWRDKPIKGFYVRDEAKDHGMKKLIEGHIEDGSSVIIIDDVTTAGGSVMKAVEAVRARNCNVLKIISIVDREEGASERFQQEGLAFVSLFTKGDFPGIETT